MIKYYKTIDNVMTKISEPEPGCWISVIDPSTFEKEILINKIGVFRDFVNASVDEEERPHIDYDDDTEQRLIIFDYPSDERHNNDSTIYSTLPLGMILMKDYIVTISLYDNHNITDMAAGNIRGADTTLKLRFCLLLMFRIAQRFLIYLRQIDKLSSFTEKKMKRMMSNSEVIYMMELEKSLVYFSSSLNTDQVLLERLNSGKLIKLYEDDLDLMEDLIIEIKQGIDMCNIYSNILSNTMDGISAIINNNVNNIMQYLTVITIVLSIPNMVYGFYGMNVSDLPITYTWFPSLISILLVLLAYLFFTNKKMW